MVIKPRLYSPTRAHTQRDRATCMHVDVHVVDRVKIQKHSTCGVGPTVPPQMQPFVYCHVRWAQRPLDPGWGKQSVRETGPGSPPPQPAPIFDLIMYLGSLFLQLF